MFYAVLCSAYILHLYLRLNCSILSYYTGVIVFTAPRSFAALALVFLTACYPLNSLVLRFRLVTLMSCEPVPTLRMLLCSLQALSHNVAISTVFSFSLGIFMSRFLKVPLLFDFLLVSFHTHFAKHQTYQVSTATCWLVCTVLCEVIVKSSDKH